MDLKRLLVIPPLVIGVGLVAYVGSRRSGAEERPPAELARAVRTLEVERMDVVPRARGLGTAQPEATWQALAQVSAQVAWIETGLKPGTLVRKDRVLLRLDERDVELAIQQSEAALKTSRAELKKLLVTRENDRGLLEIEKRALAVSRAELKRAKDMVAAETTSDSEVDSRKRAELGQLAKVQSLENSIRASSSQEEVLRARIAQSVASLETAQRDLARTTIRAPFDCRIASLEVEVDEFASKGQVLLAADSIERTEVPAQFSLPQLQGVMAGPGRKLPQLGKWIWKHATDGEAFAAMFGLEATVVVRSGQIEVSWPAKLVRASPEVDPVTRTTGMVVAVDQSYRLARPGVRPPLVKGMFCEVELRGRARKACVAIPREALHEGDRVYVMDKEKRLRGRQVQVEHRLARLVVVREGLEAGEVLVLSDPIPAIEGMLLDPQPDTEALARLKREASGQ